MEHTSRFPKGDNEADDVLLVAAITSPEVILCAEGLSSTPYSPYCRRNSP